MTKETFTILLVLLFLIVTFLQSGFDKIIDWKGNVGFIKEHFEASPLKNWVPFLVGVILVIELIAGFLMLVGGYQVLVNGTKNLAFYGVALSGIALIFLLIGQRLAKDYAGAMSLAVYFIICLFGMFLLM